MGAPPKSPISTDVGLQKVVRGKKERSSKYCRVSIGEAESCLTFLCVVQRGENYELFVRARGDGRDERVKKLQDGETPKCSTSLSLFLVTKGEESVQFLSSMPLATFSLFPFAVAALQGVIRNRGNELFGAL